MREALAEPVQQGLAWRDETLNDILLLLPAQRSR